MQPGYLSLKIDIAITIFLTFLFFTSCNTNPNPRKTNFPKKIDFVEKMPAKDSLWIFVMAGQSNMAGRGFVEPQDTVPNKRILTIDSLGQWIYAKEPLHFYEPSMSGLDCGLSFANALLNSVPKGVSIGMIPCAVGGSSIEKWLNDETFRGVKLKSNFKEKIALAQKQGTVKGILWHQGESNAKPELIPAYSNNLKNLMDFFRTTVKNDYLPIFIGQLGPYATPAETRDRWNTLNSIIENFAQTDTNIHIINTQDLEHKGDTLHFNSASQRLMGKRFAQKYLRTLK